MHLLRNVSDKMRNEVEMSDEMTKEHIQTIFGLSVVFTHQTQVSGQSELMNCVFKKCLSKCIKKMFCGIM